MKRFHVHLHVADLSQSIHFYSQLFASPPSVVKSDYAKWMIDDPRLNFAISCTGHAPGIDHLGLQADDAAELAELGQRLAAAGGSVIAQPNAVCCYAQSDKAWTEDPQGTRWETFHSHGEATSFHGIGQSGGEISEPKLTTPAACCASGSNCC